MVGAGTYRTEESGPGNGLPNLKLFSDKCRQTRSMTVIKVEGLT